MRIAFIIIITVVFASCKKKEEVSSVSISSFSLAQQTSTTANVSLKLAITGDPSILEKGVICTVDPNASFFNKRIAFTEIGVDFNKLISVNSPNTTFYVRPYVVTNRDTLLGEIKSFTTGLLYSVGIPLHDVDGNSYETIWINGQHWTAENLKTTSFANGNEMPEDETLSQYSTETAAAYYSIAFDETYDEVHGKLYNQAALHDSRGVCPTGWHVPTEQDIVALFNYLDYDNLVGGKLKSTGIVSDGTGYWEAPNGQANNYSGLNVVGGLPQDASDPTNLNFFYQRGGFAFFSDQTYHSLILYYHHGTYNTGYFSQQNGMFIRCVEN